mmetsp:Transcript_46620/g.118016  ORF Transcript_46620/g.118016 Transcript_46620/m.118016 type:complete len:311 (-) Transcript_46620:69-1001(-)
MLQILQLECLKHAVRQLQRHQPPQCPCHVPHGTPSQLHRDERQVGDLRGHCKGDIIIIKLIERWPHVCTLPVHWGWIGQAQLPQRLYWGHHIHQQRQVMGGVDGQVPQMLQLGDRAQEGWGQAGSQVQLPQAGHLGDQLLHAGADIQVALEGLQAGEMPQPPHAPLVLQVTCRMLQIQAGEGSHAADRIQHAAQILAPCAQRARETEVVDIGRIRCHCLQISGRHIQILDPQRFKLCPVCAGDVLESDTGRAYRHVGTIKGQASESAEALLQLGCEHRGRLRQVDGIVRRCVVTGGGPVEEGREKGSEMP